MEIPSGEQLLVAIKERQFTIFREVAGKGPNLNLIGLRSIPGKADSFDDLICVLWERSGSWRLEMFTATLDPGMFYLKNPSRVSGTAVLCPGQHKGAFTLGSHKGDYPCLTQTRSLPTWRDANKDGLVDYNGKVYTDSQGIQIHHAGTDSQSVANWSAGCQVISNIADWQKFWSLITASATAFGPKFSYTLLHW